LNEKVLDGDENYPQTLMYGDLPNLIKGNKKGDTDAGRQLSLASIAPYYSLVILS